MRVHPLAKRVIACADGIKAGSRQQLLLVFEFQHFKVGCNAARKFPGMESPTRSPSSAAPTGAITEAEYCYRSFLPDTPACAHALRIAKIAEFNPAVHCHHVVWHPSGEHIWARSNSAFNASAIGNQHRRVAPAEYRCVRHPGRYDDSWSGHFYSMSSVLRVSQKTYPKENPHRQAARV